MIGTDIVMLLFVVIDVQRQKMFDEDNVEDADNGEGVAHNQLSVCLHCVRVLETEVQPVCSVHNQCARDRSALSSSHLFCHCARMQHMTLSAQHQQWCFVLGTATTGIV